MYKPVPSRIDKKIPRGRKISYRESKGENNYLHHLEFQLTGQLSVQQNLKSSAQRIDEARTRIFREPEPYDKSRSKSCGRVNSPQNQNREEGRANRTPSLNRTLKSISKSQNKSKVSKSKEKQDRKKQNEGRKSSKSKHRKQQQTSFNKDQSITKIVLQKKRAKNPIVGIMKEPLKKQQKDSNLKRKCINLIHNKLLLEQKNYERNKAAIKIQAWFRGHLVRRRMQRQYELLLEQEQLLHKVKQESKKVQNAKPQQILINGLSLPSITLKEKSEEDFVNPIGISPILISDELQTIQQDKIQKANWHKLHELALWQSSVSDRVITQISQEQIHPSSGISTNWQSVRHYLRLLNGLICMKHLQQFERNCSAPFGLTPKQKLALLHEEGVVTEDEQNVVVFVLTDSVYDEAEDLYFKSSNIYSRIHHQAIFDCYNQTLARLRPYYKRLGRPYPWALMNFEEPSHPQRAMQQAQSIIRDYCSCLCGLFPRIAEESSAFLEDKREAMLRKTLDKWISETGNIWFYIEDQITELMLQVSVRIFNEIISEFCKSTITLLYRRRFSS